MAKELWEEFKDSIMNSTTFNPGFVTKPELVDQVFILLKGLIKFFLNSKNEPMVYIGADVHQKEWRADSERVRDLVTILYYEFSCGDILTKRELGLFLSKIREKCRRGEKCFSLTEIKEAEENPIVNALLYFMNDNEYFDGRTVDLLELLQQTPFAKSGSKRNEIPPFTNIFSRQLNQLIPIFLELGIEVTIQHRESGSRCQIYRAENFQVEPDPENTVKTDYTLSEPSVVTPSDTNDLQQPDGSDDTDDDFSIDPQPSTQPIRKSRDSSDSEPLPEPDD